MKNKEKKKYVKSLAEENLNYFFSLLEKRFFPEYDKFYIKEIKRISQSFNIRLKREEKLKFCKKCETYLDSKTLEIRINSGSKDYICKNCGSVRKFRFK